MKKTLGKDVSNNGLSVCLSIHALIAEMVTLSQELTIDDLDNMETMYRRGMLNAKALIKGKQSEHKPAY